jgi:iron(III) transport system ATP-binding protein
MSISAWELDQSQVKEKNMYLSLQNLSKVFPTRGNVGEVTAVNNISLEIERGELVTLLGPSGCGKTTTLRMIAGFDFPTSGRILLDGAEINPLPPNKRGMSMVFQSYAIFPHLNVFENIAYGLNVRRLPQSQIKKQVNRVLELVHLGGYEERAPNQLSGGQQQRVALARALVMEPKVLLMDEPLSNLDAKLRVQMRTEIRRIQKTLGITSVYVTHDQIEAMTLSDRVVVMNQGVIEQIGTPVEVYRYPGSPFVADFIGRANFTSGVVQSARNGILEVKTLGETVKLVHCKGEFKPKDKISLIIRPEMVTIRKSGGLFKGIIRRAVYLGDVIEYDVEVAGMLITGTETDPNRQEIFPEGSTVTVDLAAGCIQALHA